ncbi:MAG: GNAT family N-acetyltransferase [Clostridiales bacterium]|nr:GNAT family N-acetyltransferase [Clostridiales bacterium]
MQTLFRQAVPADAPVMARLVASAWRKAYRGILSDTLLDGIDPDQRSIRIRESIENNPDFWYYVLEADGEIAGVSGLCALKDDGLPDTGEIMVFYIRPDLQGRGLGKIMMRHALEALRSHGFSRFALWVLADNSSACAFYEAMGFRLDGAEKILPQLENAHTVRYLYKEP